MNFPFLKRLPKNKRFFYEPRYYDPVKEDIKYRTEKVKGDIKREKISDGQSIISEGFSKNKRRATTASSSQLVLITLLAGGFVGYLYYGNVALWIFLGLFALYILLRTRKIFD